MERRAHTNLADEIAQHLNGGLLQRHMHIDTQLVVTPVPNEPHARVFAPMGIVPLQHGVDGAGRARDEGLNAEPAPGVDNQMPPRKV